MKISRKWLNRLVEIEDISTKELADTLTSAGLEVEGIEQLASGTGLVIGEVLTCVDHPDSDHLHVTTVNLGNRIEQIVCGAPNVAAGQKVIVAVVGSILPALEIKKATVRGVESNGMICSLKELGVDEKIQSEHDLVGIKVLNKEAIVGTDPLHYLGLDDEILDIKQTPNRSDFNAMQSIAHEVSALFNRPLITQPVEENLHGGKPSDFRVASTTPHCHFFLAKEVVGLEIKESPQWIQQALIGSGMHPINNLVDISNLVMLETGQPNHFYDSNFFDKKEITIIQDYSGLEIGLDGEEYFLTEQDTIISSNQKPIGIAGIKGLGNSMIQEDTSSIVIEIANFDPVAIRNTTKHLGVVTEASLRFVKPMDPRSCEKALGRILYLLKEYAGLKEENIHESVVYQENKIDFSEPKVSVTVEDVNGLLGTNFSISEIADVFERLSFQPTIDNNKIVCTIPSYRQDIIIKEDLIEEVIRVIGFDRIESSLPLMPLTMGQLTQEQSQSRVVEQTLSKLGLNQVVSYTLVSKRHTDNPMSLGQPEEILSPLSESRQFIRTNLSTSLLDVLHYNHARKNFNNGYFEVSQVYAKNKNELRLGIVGSGHLSETLWMNQATSFDYYTAKGLFEKVLDALGINLSRVKYVENTMDTKTYHPYQSALIKLDNQIIGIVGVLHPNLKLKQAILLEVNLTKVFNVKKAKTKFKALQKYPQVTRDLAIVVDHDSEVAQLIDKAFKAGRPYLVDVMVFDVFSQQAKKSVGLRLTYEASDHTLTEQQVNSSVDNVLESLKNEFGALLR